MCSFDLVSLVLDLRLRLSLLPVLLQGILSTLREILGVKGHPVPYIGFPYLPLGRMFGNCARHDLLMSRICTTIVLFLKHRHLVVGSDLYHVFLLPDSQRTTTWGY